MFTTDAVSRRVGVTSLSELRPEETGPASQVRIPSWRKVFFPDLGIWVECSINLTSTKNVGVITWSVTWRLRPRGEWHLKNKTLLRGMYKSSGAKWSEILPEPCEWVEWLFCWLFVLLDLATEMKRFVGRQGHCPEFPTCQIFQAWLTFCVCCGPHERNALQRAELKITSLLYFLSLCCRCFRWLWLDSKLLEGPYKENKPFYYF